jgi:hypothetical protein
MPNTFLNSIKAIKFKIIPHLLCTMYLMPNPFLCHGQLTMQDSFLLAKTCCYDTVLYHTCKWDSINYGSFDKIYALTKQLHVLNLGRQKYVDEILIAKGNVYVWSHILIGNNPDKRAENPTLEMFEELQKQLPQCWNFGGNNRHHSLWQLVIDPNKGDRLVQICKRCSMIKKFEYLDEGCFIATHYYDIDNTPTNQ